MKIKAIEKQLKALDKNQELFITIGDDAYPAKLRFFESNGKVTAFVVIDNTKEHRNFPEGYNGAKEVFINEKS